MKEPPPARASLSRLPVAMLTLVLCYSAPLPAASQTAVDVRPLVPGAPLERELSGGQTHSFRVALAAGQFFLAAVRQMEIDVSVEMLGPDGRGLFVVDAQSETRRSESLMAIVEVAGDYLINIRSLNKDAPAGRYEIKVEEIRPAAPQDVVRVAAERNFAEGVRLGERGGAGFKPDAVKMLEAALSGYREAGDRRGEAKTLLELGLAYASGNKPEALAPAREALALFRELGDQPGVAASLYAVGTYYYGRGEMPEALGYFEQVISLSHALGSRDVEAQALNRAGIVRSRTGEAQTAVENYGRSLALFRAVGDRRGEARVLNNLGMAYKDLGEHRQALDSYGQGLALARAAGNLRLEAVLLGNMGHLHVWLFEEDQALDRFRQALDLSRRTGFSGSEASVLDGIGAVHYRRGEFQQALEFHQQSLAIREKSGDRAGQAAALGNSARAWHQLGESEKALELMRETLRLQREVNARYSEPDTLYHMATVERDRGRLAEALADIEAALELNESLRSSITSPELRASFVAHEQMKYEFYVDLLMRLHEKSPSAGHDAEALAAAERARARGLLEALIEARADIRRGVDAALLAREIEVQKQLGESSRLLSQLLGSKSPEGQVAAARKQLENMTSERRQVEAQIRQNNPRYAALAQPPRLGLREIREQALDDQTVLLEFSVGKDRSFLWAVTTNSLSSYTLPGRAEIEKASRTVHDLLTVRQPKQGLTGPQRTAVVAEADAKFQAEAAALGRMIFGPVADRLRGEWRGKRLAVVAPGALEYLPLGVLPVPGGDAPLIADFEVVNLPSASVLTVIRRETAGRQAAPKTLAVLADPVFETHDPRVLAAAKKNVPVNLVARVRSAGEGGAPSLLAASPALERAARGVSRDGLTRLPFSREEAEAISAFAPQGSALKATDFRANRSMATGGELGSYRIIHFATHGLLNSEHPELSGLVLSLLGEDGRPQDGFLRLHEIYNLKLPAEVVVLSACQTALGKEIWGEGLVGLTRGFMYAGARRVVASLWQVDDLATAELMKRFYRGMLRQGLRPAAALRAAQLELAREKRWAAPYYWAGFVLLGEWR